MIFNNVNDTLVAPLPWGEGGPAAVGRGVLISLLTVLFAACSPPQNELSPDPLSYGAALSATCAGCHSAGAPDMPDISDWSSEQIAESLTAFRDLDGETVMHRLSKGFSDEDIAAISKQWGVK